MEHRWQDSLTDDLVAAGTLPPYAIVSHTDTEEAIFKDLVNCDEKAELGYGKIRLCGQQAKSCSASICDPCAEFFRVTIGVVQEAVETSFYRRYGHWLKFIPVPGQVPEPHSADGMELVNTPWTKHANKFAILNSGLCPTYKGMNHDLSPQTDLDDRPWGFGRDKICILEDLPHARSLGLFPQDCYVCHIINPENTTEDREGLQYQIKWHSPYLLSDLSKRWPVKGTLCFWNKDDVASFDVIDLKAGHSKGNGFNHSARSIPFDIISEKSIDFIKTTWLGPCLSTHTHCYEGSRQIELPSRLIYVQKLEQNITARLVPTRGVTGIVKYVTLSHSWGTVKFVTLSMGNIEEFQRSLPLSGPDFNQTFKEAMTITDLLGYQYIWIDSLCIIQDSRSDWLYECPRMGTIYQSSDLNISATGFANARNGMLLGRRNLSVPPRIRTNDQVEYLINLNEYTSAQWPLIRRGWVFQEHLLSPRTLHFSPRGLIWECRSSLFSEVWPHIPGIPGRYNPSRFNVNYLQNRKRLFEEVDEDLDIGNYVLGTPKNLRQEPEPFANIRLWYRMMCEYATMDLTHNGDKLHAIQGLANVMQKKFGLNYLAGHWEEGLLLSLTWVPLASVSSQVYGSFVAPSWSWASANQHKISLNLENEGGCVYESPLPVAEFLGADFLEDEDDDAPPQSHCRLRLKGPIHRLGGNADDQITQLPPRKWPENWQNIVFKGWPWEPRLEIRFRLESPWMPDRFIRLLNDPGFVSASDDNDTNRQVGVEIRIDAHRRITFLTDLNAGAYPVLNTQPEYNGKETGGQSMCGAPKALFLLWLTLEMCEEKVERGKPVDPFQAKGLLLKQVGVKGDAPVCERLGIIVSDMFWPREDLLDIFKNMKRQVVYLL